MISQFDVNRRWVDVAHETSNTSTGHKSIAMSNRAGGVREVVPVCSLLSSRRPA